MHGNTFSNQLLCSQRRARSHCVIPQRTTERLRDEQFGERDFAAFECGNAFGQDGGCFGLLVAQFRQRMRHRDDVKNFYCTALINDGVSWRR